MPEQEDQGPLDPTPEEEAARSPRVDVGPGGVLEDEHGPIDPATAEAEIPGHGGWRRGVVGLAVGAAAGLVLRLVVRDREAETRHRSGF